MKKVIISVDGRVQGVGFRYSSKELADRLDIKGLVRNESDGSVYIEAIGDSEKINQFIEALKAGPSPFAQVHSVSVTEDQTLQDFVKFNISN